MGCNDCKNNKNNNNEKESFAMEMLKESNKNAKRWFIAFCVVLGCWLATIGGFLLYLNQYCFESEETYTVEQSTDGGGNLNNYGDITNGVPKSNSN